MQNAETVLGVLRERGRKGLPRGLPSVAGVGSIRAYATEDWSLWQRR